MNKVARSLTALALSAALAAGSALTSFAYEPKTAEANADVLNTLGLFKGTETAMNSTSRSPVWKRSLCSSVCPETSLTPYTA